MQHLIKIIVVAIALGWANGAGAGVNRPSIEEWQLERIYNPEEYVLESESRGLVFIYDGLSETRVDQILDDHFERIEAMMFTRVKRTDAAGEVLLDPDTGEELTMDDGCD